MIPQIALTQISLEIRYTFMVMCLEKSSGRLLGIKFEGFLEENLNGLLEKFHSIVERSGVISESLLCTIYC